MGARPLTLLAGWLRRCRRMLPQLLKFGVVGLFGLVVDVGGFNALRYYGGEGPFYDAPLTAKLLSGSAATVVAWLGNRYWTFRQARRSAAHHEFLMFVVACTIGSGIALSCLAFSHYVLDLRSALADNISANVVGLGLATLFRFWAYRTHVFSEPAVRGHPPATTETIAWSSGSNAAPRAGSLAPGSRRR